MGCVDENCMRAKYKDEIANSNDIRPSKCGTNFAICKYQVSFNDRDSCMHIFVHASRANFHIGSYKVCDSNNISNDARAMYSPCMSQLVAFPMMIIIIIDIIRKCKLKIHYVRLH